MCSTIASQQKFDEKMWVWPTNEVVKVSARERKKLEKLKEALEKLITSEK